jgi:hypothetical protein
MTAKNKAAIPAALFNDKRLRWALRVSNGIVGDVAGLCSRAARDSPFRAAPKIVIV